MKILLTAIFLAFLTGLVHAECKSSLAFGQYQHDCDQPQTHSNSESVEYTQIPYNANGKISRHAPNQQNVASLEQSVSLAQTTQSPFKPTHTQLDQVRQLLEYARQQGCHWMGPFDQPELVCPP